MRKMKLTMTCREIVSYSKRTVGLVLKSTARIPYILLVVLASISCWLYYVVARFCREHTKAVVIMGFALCFFAMLFEFVYFKLELAKCSDQTSKLILRNYQLEQTDRYNIGYHDAMAKNKEMLTQCKSNE